jgi:hypothetical protein
MVAVFGICGVVVAACSSPSPPRPTSKPLPGSTASAQATTIEHKDPGYLAARQEWLDEGQVWSSAGQGGPLELAVTDLEHGEVTDSGNKSEYPAITAALTNLVKLPDAMDTPAQDAEARAAVAQIDQFFHLHVTRGCDWPSALKACWITP